MGRVFLVHWHEEEAKEKARELAGWGWDVRVEHADGAKAVRHIGEEPPDAVVISLARLPAHGRETADALQRMKTTRSTPIVFVDGTADKVAEARAKVPGALWTTWPALRATLAMFRKTR